MPLLCCDVGLVSELRLTAGCVLMDLASPASQGRLRVVMKRNWNGSFSVGVGYGQD